MTSALDFDIPEAFLSADALLVRLQAERARAAALEQQVTAIRVALKAHADSDLVALAEATMRQSDRCEIEHERADAAEQQVAVLRVALRAFLDADSDLLPPRVRRLVREARAALVNTDAPRMVRLDDVERILGIDAMRAARAFLGVKQ